MLEGDVYRSALAFVEERRAPLVTVGARQLAGLDRLFAPSLGRGLAAHAPVPALIVPPRPGGGVIRRTPYRPIPYS